VGLRVLLSCVSENRPGWYDKVYNLVLSVRSFGGSLADEQVVVNFVDGADPEVARTLEGLGAEVRVVERFDVRNPTPTSCGCWSSARSSTSTCWSRC